MDASAYLKGQGWRGDGHSLDRTNRGIKKPLLVGKKVDVLGVGSDKHAALSDQWWLRAFDDGLKKLGTGEQTVLASVQRHGVRRGDLYSRFVKGDKFVGSIGQDHLHINTVESTPPIFDGSADMAVDVPPRDKLMRVVGNGSSKDAMLHLLQNPQDAPASMAPMLDKKRKRAETAGEKRARRKIQHTERSKPKKEGKDIDPAKEEETRTAKDVERRANALVLEAQRRGIIPLGPNEIRKGITPLANDANAVPLGGQSSGPDELQEIVQSIGWNTQRTPKATGKLKADKYAREKMKRELKKAAKAYIMGEEVSPDLLKKAKKVKTPEQKAKSAEKRAEAARKDAERLAKREERTQRKAAQRASRKVEKAQVMEAMQAEKEGAAVSDAVNGSPVEQVGGVDPVPPQNGGNDFETGADEIKLGEGLKNKTKKIPGVGVVDRYPTKAEKRAVKMAAMALREGVSKEEIQARRDAEQAAKQEIERKKIDNYRAMKLGMGYADYQIALAKGEVHTPAVQKKNLPPEKLAEYQERAAEKGITLEAYIKRREEKAAAKLFDRMDDLPPETKRSRKSDGPGFVIDTEGDQNLANGIPADGTVRDVSIYYQNPTLEVPLHPRIWEGKVVKDLPKHIRAARKNWMAARREEKKARRVANGADPKRERKARGQRKVEAREAFVKAILVRSRQAGGQGGQTTTIDGVENIPLVKLESTEGVFKKGEVNMARTVARRVLRNEKRAQREKQGRGKGWKKREKAAKQGSGTLRS